MNKIIITNCGECKHIMIGFNGEYRCRIIPNPKNEYRGPDYFGDKPPREIPSHCPKIKNIY